MEAAWIETDRKATGLVFALCLVARYGVIGLGRWLTHRPRRRHRTLRPPASLRWVMVRDERTGRVVVRDRSLGDPPPGLS